MVFADHGPEHIGLETAGCNVVAKPSHTRGQQIFKSWVAASC
jgi:hypothetical protein